MIKLKDIKVASIVKPFVEHPLITWNILTILSLFIAKGVLWPIFFITSLVFYGKLRKKRKLEAGAGIANKEAAKPPVSLGSRNLRPLEIIVVIGIIAILSGVVIVALDPAGQLKKVGMQQPAQQSATAPQPASPSSAGPGAEGVVRSSSDSSGIVFIATTPEAFDEMTKALIAQDAYGMLQLAAEGKVFGVTNGTRVKVIDIGFTKKRVRILQGVTPVDQDKVGLAGWVPYEWAKPN